MEDWRIISSNVHHGRSTGLTNCVPCSSVSSSFLKGDPSSTFPRLNINWDFGRGENIRLEGEGEVEVTKQEKTVVLYRSLAFVHRLTTYP